MATVESATCKRELEIEVPADEVRKEVEKIAATFQKQARVSGFRPGKTPLALVKQRFREEIREEVLHQLVPEFFRRKLQEEKLEPVETPDIADVHFDPDSDEPLKFKAVFEVMPEFELQDYNGLDVEITEPAVSDEEVEKELTGIQEQQATFAAVEDRELADGDFALVSFQGQPVNQAAGAAPVKVDEVLCEIGGANTLKEFSENLRGAKPGEERSFEVAYPADMDDKRLAGKTLRYTVKIAAVKQKQVPELNDDFARDLGKYTSLQAVRDDIRQQTLEAKKHQAEHDAKDKLMNRLVEMHDFPVPEALVEKQVQSRMERTVRQLASQGVDPAKLNVDWAKVKASHKEGAVRDVKAGLILGRIAEKEGIQVSEEETEREIDKIVRQSRPKDAAAVRARLHKPAVSDTIKNRLRSDKTLDFIYQKASPRPAP